MNEHESTSKRKTGPRLSRRLLATEGATLVEYILVAAILAIGLIYGFRQARIRESRVVAYQARVIKSLDLSAPGEIDFIDPLFGEDYGAPVCNLEGTVCSRPGQCFGKGTLVAAQAGLVPIENLRVGDAIWSRDEETGELALRPILRRYVTPGREVMDLNVAGPDGVETIRSTTGHPIWVAGKGWTNAADLAVNQELWSASGDALHVAAPSTTGINVETVYNLEIAEFHTYFVGRHGIWVHNATKSTGPGAEVPPCKKGQGKAGQDELPKDKLSSAKKAGIPLGGSYKDVREAASGRKPPTGVDVGGEVHHMPAQDVWDIDEWPKGTKRPFSPGKGPAIWMEKADHELTASWGGGDGPDKYRAKQLEKVKEGDVCGAIQMDITNVRRLFQSKYDAGIKEMLAYVRSQGHKCPGLR